VVLSSHPVLLSLGVLLDLLSHVEIAAVISHQIRFANGQKLSELHRAEGSVRQTFDNGQFQVSFGLRKNSFIGAHVTTSLGCKYHRRE
jgi:hypothetical protein